MGLRIQILHRHSDGQRQHVFREYRRDVVATHGRIRGTDAVEVLVVHDTDFLVRVVVGKREQAVGVAAVAANNAPHAVVPAVEARVRGIRVVGSVAALVTVRNDGRLERKLFGNAAGDGVAPTGVLGLPETGAAEQPLEAVHHQMMFFFMGASLGLDVHAVTVESAQHRRERVAARKRSEVVDGRTEHGLGNAVRTAARVAGVCGRREAELVVQFREPALYAT